MKREPDKKGLQHYLAEISTGKMKLNDLKTIFENSDEFKKLNELSQSISQYYRDILKREPDKKGLQHFLKEISAGRMTLEDLKTIFENSDEFKKLKTMEKIDQIPTKTKDDLIMYLNPTDAIVSKLIFLNKEWEPFETLILKNFLNENSIFIDIGSHIGYYTLIAASIAKNGKVFSFEPVSHNFKLLKKNVAKNNFTNIKLYNCAVSNTNEFVNIFLTRASNTGDNRFFDNDFEGYMGELKKELVECVTLDEIFDDSIKPDIIKMDIQGGEMFAMKGMKNLVQNTDKLVLLTEFWPTGIAANKESPAEFLQLLHDLDFDIYDIDIHIKKLIKKSDKKLLQDYPTPSLAQTNLLCLKNISLPSQFII